MWVLIILIVLLLAAIARNCSWDPIGDDIREEMYNICDRHFDNDQYKDEDDDDELE